MNTVINAFRRAAVIFLSVYFVLSSLAVSPAAFSPQNEADLQMEIALISDVHTETNNLGRFNVITKCFKNLNGGKENIDALILLGDNTMNGQQLETMFFYGIMEKVNPIRPYYPIMGNHDVGNSTEADYAKLRTRQLGFLQTFVDENIQQLYYSKELNGCHLIFLAPDAAESPARHLSEEQLDWLEAELNAAAESGKPIFVFNHYPYYYMDDSCAERYVSLMNSYDNLFVIVGHMHYYSRVSVIPGEKQTPEIWVPCLSMLDEESRPIDTTGRGYLMDLYPDRVEFHGFNYYTNEYYDFNAVYPLSAAAETP